MTAQTRPRKKPSTRKRVGYCLVMFFAASPWTQWMAPVLLIVVILGLVGMGIGYLIKVEAPKHPKK